MKSLWQGPYQDGVTQSMLSYWLQGCPHRFWIRYVLGLSEVQPFNHKMQYGSMFHACCEQYEGRAEDFDKALGNYAAGLLQRYPTDSEQITYWETICRLQFPFYLRYWEEEDRQLNTCLKEEVFDYRHLVHGRHVRLRGKWDEVVSKRGVSKSIYLKETKTKGLIDQEGLCDTLHGNLQTMFYCYPLRVQYPSFSGVLYNVIRRPFSDMHAPKPRKKEDTETFLRRAFHYYETKSFGSHYPVKDHLDQWFFRWWVVINENDLSRFRHETLDPILWSLCRWWKGIEKDPLDPWKSPLHYCLPFGLFDGKPLRGDYYNLIVNDSQNGLQPTILFRELQED